MNRFLLFILLAVSFCYSQEMLKLYDQSIPSVIKQNQNLKKLVDVKLSLYGALEPDLIYYYLNFLDLYYNRSVKNNEENTLHFLETSEKNALLLRKKWAREEISQIEKLKLNNRLKHQAANFYKHFLIPDFKEKSAFVPLNVDQNKMYYFVKLYYTRKNNPNYDPSKNYKKLCTEMENDNIKKYYSLINSPDAASSSITRKIVNKSLDEWYLFDKADHRNAELDIRHHQLLIKYLQNNYREFRHADITLKLGSVLINQNYNHEDFLKEFDTKFEVYRNIESGDRLQLSIGLQYKYTLRDYYDRFSYINFEAGWSLNPEKLKMTQQLDLSKIYVHYSSDFQNKTTYYYDLVEANISDIQFQTWFGKISTPLLFLRNNMMIDLGVLVQLNSLSYNTDYRTRVRITGENAKLGQTAYTERYHKESNFSDFTLSPGLDFLYILKFKYLFQIQSYYNRNLFLSFDIGYSF